VGSAASGVAAELHATEHLDWPQAVIESPHVRALMGAQVGPNRAESGRPRAGGLHASCVLTDGHGTPPAVPLTSGNHNDVPNLMPLLDKVTPVHRRIDRPWPTP
jgi:hypothetical protein